MTVGKGILGYERKVPPEIPDNDVIFRGQGKYLCYGRETVTLCLLLLPF